MILHQTIINIFESMDQNIPGWGNGFFTAVLGLLVAILAFFVPHVVERISRLTKESKIGIVDKLIPNPTFYVIALGVGIALAISTFLLNVLWYKYVVAILISGICVYALYRTVRYVEINYGYTRDPRELIRKIYFIKNNDGMIIDITKIGEFIEVLKERISAGDYDFINEGLDNLLRTLRFEDKIQTDSTRTTILKELVKIHNHLKKTVNGLSIVEMDKRDNYERLQGKLFSFIALNTKEPSNENSQCKSKQFVVNLLSELTQSDLVSLVDIKQSGRLYYLYLWYIDLVFVYPAVNKFLFDLDLLPDFNNKLFNALRMMLKIDPSGWKGFVNFAHDGLLGDSHKSIYDLENLLVWPRPIPEDQYLAAQNKVAELEKSAENIFSKEDISTWVKSFNEFRQTYQSFIPAGQKEQADTLTYEIINSIHYRYKKRSLQRIIWGACAYSLFLGNYGAINDLWQYHHPDDSWGRNCGNDMVQRTVSSIIKFYFSEPLYSWTQHFWEDHHGEELYYKKYFVLSLAMAVKPKMSLKKEDGSDVSVKKKYEKEIDGALSRFSRGTLLEIRHEVDAYKEICNSFLKTDPLLIKEVLKYDLSVSRDKMEAEKLIREVLNVLDLLREVADSQDIKKISESMLSAEKVKKLKDDFYKDYDAELMFHKIIRKKGQFEIQSNAPAGAAKKKMWIHSKEELVEDSVITGNSASWFGEDWALSNDYWLIQEVKKKCTRASSFEDALAKVDEQSLIFLIGTDIFKLKDRYPNFNYDYSDRKNNPELDGYYQMGAFQAPVYSVMRGQKESYVLILNKNKLGKLIYYKGPTNVVEGVSIDIKEYKTIDDTKENDVIPDWLKFKKERTDERTETEMNAYLREVVGVELISKWAWKCPQGDVSIGYYSNIN